jgi:hypothetical protein
MGLPFAQRTCPPARNERPVLQRRQLASLERPASEAGRSATMPIAARRSRLQRDEAE